MAATCIYGFDSPAADTRAGSKLLQSLGVRCASSLFHVRPFACLKHVAELLQLIEVVLMLGVRWLPRVRHG